jgi:hypothetical protein
MSESRSFLLDALRRASLGLEVTNEELLRAVPDPSLLGEIEKDAWYKLSQWADDGDIRVRDAAYGDMQEKQIAAALADLEALEAGYSPEEIGWGDHAAPHVSCRSCLLVLAGIGLAAYVVSRLL